ncbi:MAG: WGR domain-containing protein [Dokdonella sp.]
MRLFMQTKPEASESPRYYQIDLNQDLLGGWTLYREWGQQGGRISSKRELYIERDLALGAFEQARDLQLRKGFQVMFSRGLDGPR